MLRGGSHGGFGPIMGSGPPIMPICDYLVFIAIKFIHFTCVYLHFYLTRITLFTIDRHVYRDAHALHRQLAMYVL